MTQPRAILSAPGSRGDVNPVVAIGRELTKRGFECFLSVAEPYADIVRDAGLTANVVIDSQSFHAVASQREFWKPLAGARRVLSEVAEQFFRPHLEFLDSMVLPGNTVLVAHPLDFASRVYRETTPGCLLSSIQLAPSMMRHPELPPRLLPDHGWSRPAMPAGWPRLNRLSYWLGDRLIIDRAIGPVINNARHHRAKLPPRSRLMHDWWRSPDQVLGLYPGWFAPEIAARYARVRQATAPLQCIGFPLDDGTDPVPASELPADRPLIMTTGSAHPGDHEFPVRVAELCQPAGVPVVWCCPSNPGGVSHPNLRCVGYVPLGQWLPHCHAILHHGGIGTTSRAIDAGVPQMIRPMAFDQFDNAARVERFGLGSHLRRASDLPSALTELLARKHFQPPPHEHPQSAANLAAQRIAALL
ncbi:glycosyltransferase [Allorhodopirellula solitaria]|uniref:MurG-like transferase n=1 Tax=Allorhodopirellula solitaria TaxID=2527987 RepID=A0A5C5X8U0_9BACT|nr:nucleotide disphospho-sugar-binding domain-containing protein [Allorhodopirellula solitaria]TWT59284.1 MurG-like transferase [Allorhodopirellula solitaria]